MEKFGRIAILGGARDFHAMDWYRAVRRVCSEREVVFVTDLLGGEGYKNLAKPEDKMASLFIIDNLLCSKPSTWANLWRNIVKLIVSPLQAIKLRSIVNDGNFTVVHAHPMYYMMLCWMSGVPYIGTPQGSEMLIRPTKSKVYKYFAAKVLRGAQAVTVDSYQMKTAVKAISGVNAHVIQNGINVDEVLAAGKGEIKRFRITSIRGVAKLYRTNEIVTSRNESLPEVSMTFIYPFFDAQYLQVIRDKLGSLDEDLGRLDKAQMYRLLHETLLVISIPSSDSSPRSVYEAIFAGCCVAVTSNSWIDLLPECMRARIYIVDLGNANWLKDANDYALIATSQPYVPSEQALNIFDENRSIRKVVESFYL